ncbi:MAG: ribonuclease HII [Armatimonadetes bacterium]|nr:ribonuclease HII [Armatimonadota bacterium]
MRVPPETAWANDNVLREKYGELLCGVDEVGRGAWAGPLVVGAVVFARETFIPGLTDSKQVKAHLRPALAEEVKSKALAWAVYEVEPRLIDRKGLTWANAHASRMAAKAAAQNLEDDVNLYVLDQMPDCGLEPHTMMSKADALSHVVAAASIVAKVYRDTLMQELDTVHPGYGLQDHVGYVTPVHRSAVKNLGRVRGLHRFSYKVDQYREEDRSDLLRKTCERTKVQ